MRLVTVGYDDDRVPDLVAVRNAADEVHHPRGVGMTERWQRGLIRYGWDGDRSEYLLGYEGGVPVAWGCWTAPDRDNREAAYLEVGTHPDHRRRGHATAVLASLVERAAAEGRGKLFVEGWDAEPTRCFAHRHGFEPGLLDVNRRWYRDDADPAALDRLAEQARAHAGAYELAGWSGPTPAELLPGLVEVTASINDAPEDDLDIEDEVFSPERIADYETAQLESGFRLHRLVARCRDTGEVAGHTVVAVDEDRPHLGFQHDTAVHPKHRGHRLGLLLKVAMIRRLAEAEPRLRTVDTWNADSNEHMVAINQLLGYRVVGRAWEFQRLTVRP